MAPTSFFVSVGNSAVKSHFVDVPSCVVCLLARVTAVVGGGVIVGGDCVGHTISNGGDGG